MPSLTTTIEDTAPVLVYSGDGGSDWTAGLSSNDPSIDEYSQSNYMVTNVANANVSFSFYGTGVQIYGAKRERHGQFQITIDGLVYQPQDGLVTPPIFQTALFSAVTLTEGNHLVTMTNLGTSELDIDFLTWQTPVGQTNEGLLTWTEQDTTQSFVYTPPAAWSAGPTNAGTFSGGTGHVTQTAGAVVEYSFEGDAVAIFGPVGPNGAPYSVQLDNNPPANYSANKQFYRPQNILFQASHLGGGSHKVRLVSEAWTNSSLQFAVDFAQVFTTQSLAPSDGLSLGAIIGISLGVIVALLGVIIGLFVFLRRRSSKFGKMFRPSKKRTDPMNTVPTSFNYRPISYDDSSPLPPNTASSQQRLLHRPTSSDPMSSTGDRWPTSGGDNSYTSTSPELMLSLEQNGPDTQLVTIPYTADGKYRPDLERAPQLMPPPQGPSLNRSPSPGRPQDATPMPRIHFQDMYTQQSGSSSTVPLAPVPPPMASASTSTSSNNWSSAASGVGSMNQDTFHVQSPPQNQSLRPLPAIAPVRRNPSVPMSVSSQESNLSNLMSPPPQYQRNPIA